MEWRPIPGYLGRYEVSDDGQFASLFKGVRRLLRPFAHNKGYLMVSLWKDNKRKKFLAHRLVALAFLERGEKGPFVLHWNGIKTDNRLANLRYGDAKDNGEDARRLGEMAGWSRSRASNGLAGNQGWSKVNITVSFSPRS